ncbi:MAG: glycosyltransferase family 4 protein, partial [Gammaproteobacteria bacterium]|nr:glycosyltransferase family 4 protein [Gammaproteobacteria bacterium]
MFPRRRVALLAPEICTHGGVQSYMLRIVEALTSNADAGYDVYCISLNDGPETLKQHPLLQRCAGTAGAMRSKIRLGRHLLALPRLDTLIVGHLGPSPVGWLFSALGRTRRYLVVLHGVEAWVRARPTRRLAARRADGVVATTAYTAREFSRLNAIEEGRVCVLPLCADERHLGADKSDPEFRLDGAFKLLCVARQDSSERYKGFEMIFEALARLQDAPLPHLNLVGTGDDQPRLRKAALSLGVGDRVTFWGALDDRRLARAYEDCDVFVMPSKMEGFGIVFLEAMLRGKPCIGGAHGGTPGTAVARGGGG